MPVPISDHDSPVLYLAIELSSSAWLIAAQLLETEKPKLHRIKAGDTKELLAFIAALRARIMAKLGTAVDVACCFEAGRDGFWLHRLLVANGIASHVLEPTSVLVNRRARRAETDRLDAQGLLRVLMAYCRGDRQACSPPGPPSPGPSGNGAGAGGACWYGCRRLRRMPDGDTASTSTWCKSGFVSRTGSRIAGDPRHPGETIAALAGAR